MCPDFSVSALIPPLLFSQRMYEFNALKALFRTVQHPATNYLVMGIWVSWQRGMWVGGNVGKGSVLAALASNVRLRHTTMGKRERGTLPTNPHVPIESKRRSEGIAHIVLNPHGYMGRMKIPRCEASRLLSSLRL